MKIIITESQYRLIKESSFDNPIIKMGLNKDGYIMVKYKVTDFDSGQDVIHTELYDDFVVSDDIDRNPVDCVIEYLKSRNLNLRNSKVLKELMRQDDNNDYHEFHRDENGRYYPEAFLHDYHNYCGNNRECQNGIIRTAVGVLNIVYNSQYPIVVYRGIKPNEKFENHDHPGGYWTTRLNVAKRFGPIVYKGLIHHPEDIMILHTMENRMRFTDEFELSSHKVEVTDKFDFTKEW